MDAVGDEGIFEELLFSSALSSAFTSTLSAFSSGFPRIKNKRLLHSVEIYTEEYGTKVETSKHRKQSREMETVEQH